MNSTEKMIANNPHIIATHVLNIGAPAMNEQGKLSPGAEELRSRFFSFEVSKNGNFQMYCTTSWLIPFPEASARSRHENVIFIKTICDSRKDSTGRINNGNWNVLLQYLYTEGLFKGLFPKFKEGDKAGEEMPVVLPFNGLIVEGHISMSYVPTRDFSQKRHDAAIDLVVKSWKEVQALEETNADRLVLITNAMDIYNAYIEQAKESGEIQLSYVIYANQNGLQPVFGLSESSNSVMNPMLNFNVVKAHKVAPLSYPIHTNVVSAYCEGNIAKTKADVVKVDGKDLDYGLDWAGDNRQRMLIEGLVTDGQGKPMAVRLQLVDNNTSGNPRASKLYEILKTNPCISIHGVLRTSRLYADNRSLASIFLFDINNYYVVNTLQVTKADTSELDANILGDVDTMSTLFSTPAADTPLNVTDLVSNVQKSAANAAANKGAGNKQNRRDRNKTQQQVAAPAAPADDDGDDNLPY